MPSSTHRSTFRLLAFRITSSLEHFSDPQLLMKARAPNSTAVGLQLDVGKSNTRPFVREGKGGSLEAIRTTVSLKPIDIEVVIHRSEQVAVDQSIHVEVTAEHALLNRIRHPWLLGHSLGGHLRRHTLGPMVERRTRHASSSSSSSCTRTTARRRNGAPFSPRAQILREVEALTRCGGRRTRQRRVLRHIGRTQRAK